MGIFHQSTPPHPGRGTGDLLELWIVYSFLIWLIQAAGDTAIHIM